MKLSTNFDALHKVVQMIPAKKTVFKLNKINSQFHHTPQMVTIPEGNYQMGGNRDEDEQPIHDVHIHSFLIAQYPVTFNEWDACFQDGGSHHSPNDQGWGRGKRPVINISWIDVQHYLQWLNETTGKAYRLPSEAEWEYAARAGTNTDYWWGKEAPCNQKRAENGACFDEHRQGTEEVGCYQANLFGLYDMSGNVDEWIEDKYYFSYQNAPIEGGAAQRESHYCNHGVRGGSWHDSSRWLRSATRFYYWFNNRRNTVGFRLAHSL
ncbi:MAG: formylglycine-generating enzyme family protein [Sulfurovaceae bacterium]|nr:formylglycine-generating enzyme family protein [Sulfurovaceae bacterium]